MYGPGFVIVAGLLCASFTVLAVGAGYETWAFATSHTPITYYLRAAAHAYPPVAFVLAVALGLVVGHLSG